MFSWNANMDGKGKISDYRRKMDMTLASPALTNREKLRTLVRNQILQSSHLEFQGRVEDVVERRSNEVSSFLCMLRSAAEEDAHTGWKVKQDTEEFRVMYREGAEGSPLHTLLVEGYVDGPLDVCLCISWESGLYNRWWPQTAIPTFKVISSRCLQRVGDGEQISLVRMKVSWPLSSREAVIHYFVFEYFQDGLMVVLLNSVNEAGIPEAEEMVRIDVVGGFALQKVTADRSYFRTIANMDIKLDFVPPSFINFVSRQLVGSGFKLYKKEVASVTRGDEKFREALNDPFYARIREALDLISSTRPPTVEKQERSTLGVLEHQSGGEDGNAAKDVEFSVINDTDGSEKPDNCSLEPSKGCSSNDHDSCKEEEAINQMRKKAPMISAEVEKALVTLENVISLLKAKENGSDSASINGFNLTTNLEKKQELMMPSEIDEDSRSCGDFSNAQVQDSLENLAYRREMKESKVVQDEGQFSHSSSKSSFHKIASSLFQNHDANKTNKSKKQRFCCMHFHLPIVSSNVNA